MTKTSKEANKGVLKRIKQMQHKISRETSLMKEEILKLFRSLLQNSSAENPVKVHSVISTEPETDGNLQIIKILKVKGMWLDKEIFILIDEDESIYMTTGDDLVQTSLKSNELILALNEVSTDDQVNILEALIKYKNN